MGFDVLEDRRGIFGSVLGTGRGVVPPPRGVPRGMTGTRRLRKRQFRPAIRPVAVPMASYRRVLQRFVMGCCTSTWLPISSADSLRVPLL